MTTWNFLTCVRRSRLVRRAGSIGLLVSILSAPGDPALAAETPTTPSPTPTPGGQVVAVSGTGAIVLIVLIAAGLALLWFVPLMIDTLRASNWRRREQRELIGELTAMVGRNKELSVEELRQIVSAMDRPPRGVSGLTQSLLALVIATMVGVALVGTLLSSSGDGSDLRKTIITSLLSVLATIAGFYFGARTAQTSTEQATQPPTPKSNGRGDRRDDDDKRQDEHGDSGPTSGRPVTRSGGPSRAPAEGETAEDSAT
jgi:hypothetical protein